MVENPSAARPRDCVAESRLALLFACGDPRHAERSSLLSSVARLQGQPVLQEQTVSAVAANESQAVFAATHRWVMVPPVRDERLQGRASTLFSAPRGRLRARWVRRLAGLSTMRSRLIRSQKCAGSTTEFRQVGGSDWPRNRTIDLRRLIVAFIDPKR